MSLSAEQIKIEALSLPPEDRSELLLRLADSLGVSDDKQIDREWLAVAKQRLDELRSGQVVGVPADQVFAELRARKTRA